MERGVNPSMPKAPGVHIVCWLVGAERASTRCEDDMLPPEEVERVWVCCVVFPAPLGTRLVGGKCGPEAGVGAERAGASKKLKSSSVKVSSYSMLMLPF